MMKIKRAFGVFEFIVVLIIFSVLYILVMKGKSAIVSADTVKITKTFMGEWVNVLNSYKDRTGYNIYGTPSNSHINGSETNSSLSAPRMCYEFEVLKELDNAGINIKENLETTSTICSTYIGGELIGKPINVAFGSMRIGGYGGGRINNVVIFKDVPMDIAKRFDRYIDGEADGTRGSVITDGSSSEYQIPLEKIAGNDPAKVWEPQPWKDDDNLVTTVYVILGDR